MAEADADFFKDRFPEEWEVGLRVGWAQKIQRKYAAENGLIDRYTFSPITGFERQPSNRLKVYRVEVSKCLIVRFFDEAEKQAKIVSEWFYRLPTRLEDSNEREITTTLVNDLFFGFGHMLHEQLVWLRLQAVIKEKPEVRSEGYLNDDWTYYQKLTKLLEAMPKDRRPWREEWQKEFRALIQDFDFSKACYGRMGQKIPTINKEVATLLKNDLGRRLKNRRDRSTGEDRISNDFHAARLLKELAVGFGVALESVDRLRKR
jgi:hypothetical protein